MAKLERRNFIKKIATAAGSFAAGATLTSCNQNPSDKPVNIQTSTKTYKWRCVTVWPPNFPVLGTAVVDMAKELEHLSSGRLKIQVYGAGELVPALEVFDAVQLGAVQMGHSASYYWAGKMPSSVFFTSIPFGMVAEQMNAWLFYGGGWELWRELYEPLGIVPFPCGNTGVQMGGWFNKEINSIQDIQGLKMRMPGLGGKVIAKSGGSAVTVPGGEIYTNLERGVIDATEWIGPYHDYLMGFHKIAQYYYYPGWHEPGSVLELICNKKALEELPSELQEMVKTVAIKYNNLILSEFEAKNNEYLQRIFRESDVELRAFPEEVMKALKKNTEDVLQGLTTSDPFAKKVYDNFNKFKGEIKSWGNISSKAMTEYL
ncbi:TRAP transporter substrate-binding protein [Limibacter armeniacum]|uniref:TRAP transporter substrate-binding protein n=1 Tax=Limibacter armeniacum TaxID=466084 RepID=UPI002FE5F344